MARAFEAVAHSAKKNGHDMPLHRHIMTIVSRMKRVHRAFRAPNPWY